MSKNNKANGTKANKKIWILSVFAVFIAVAMSFVSWLIYAVFSENYRDIKQQYYSVVSRQIVEDIENSVKNGKQIDRFYGMDGVLNDMLDIVSTEIVPVNTVITDAEGNILYTSYATSNKKDEYNLIMADSHVQDNLKFDGKTQGFRITNSGMYELMIQPVCDNSGEQIGSMVLFYRSSDIERELSAQKESSNVVTALCIGATIILLVVYFLFLPRSITEKPEEENEIEAYTRKQRENKFMFIIPVVVIMAGLMVQCFISYNEYQKRYKDVMFEGATGISEYIGEIINGLNEKGVPYEKMNGLAEYLSDKVESSPLLWNVSIVNVYADTSQLLSRNSEYNVSMLITKSGNMNMHINVEISKDYIDSKMLNMLLVFVVTFAVALIMIFEFLKLPDALFTRLSGSFRKSRTEQANSMAAVLRMGAFIAYTGMYVGIPFSSVLIAQWNKSVMGLPVTFLASIPMTAELLATMLCSLLCLPIYKKMNLRVVFGLSTLISVAANAMCFLANSPEQLIALRFLSGIGFAGIKYSLNTMVSEGSVNDANTTDNLAALNAGLLGGITCGGTLGAVIASSVSIQSSYLIAGIFIFVFLVIVFVLAPWKLFDENSSKKAAKEKGTGVFSFIFNLQFLRYVLLVAVPVNFALMFVVAFFPSFVSTLGLPDVTTSYGYLINGLVGIYIGPSLLKSLSNKIGKSACVFLSLVLAAGSILILNISIPLVIVLVSVALLGLFDGFGTPASSDYYVNMPVIKRLGISQGLAVLSVIGSIIQTISPVLYSVILSSGTAGINILGIVFAAAALLFLVTIKVGSGAEKKSAVKNS